MANATEEHPGLTFDYISEEYSRFEARISHSNVKGVKHLNLVIDRPFRSSEELSAWLHAHVTKLQTDIDGKGLFADV